MTWLPRIQEILQTLADQHPTWVADDSDPKPSPRYRLNEMFAQQVCHEFGPSYGLKRADPGRPISSENLARKMGATLIAWAWENKHDGTVDSFPESEDISDQVFVPVQPVNHLNTPQNPEPDPGTPPPTPGTPVDLMPVLTELAHVRVEIAEVKATMDMVLALLNAQLGQPVTFPDYKGSLTLPLPRMLGGAQQVPIELKPEGQ